MRGKDAGSEQRRTQRFLSDPASRCVARGTTVTVCCCHLHRRPLEVLAIPSPQHLSELERLFHYPVPCYRVTSLQMSRVLEVTYSQFQWSQPVGQKQRASRPRHEVKRFVRSRTAPALGSGLLLATFCSSLLTRWVTCDFYFFLSCE